MMGHAAPRPGRGRATPPPAPIDHGGKVNLDGRAYDDETVGLADAFGITTNSAGPYAESISLAKAKILRDQESEREWRERNARRDLEGKIRDVGEDRIRAAAVEITKERYVARRTDDLMDAFEAADWLETNAARALSGNWLDLGRDHAIFERATRPPKATDVPSRSLVPVPAPKPVKAPRAPHPDGPRVFGDLIPTAAFLLLMLTLTLWVVGVISPEAVIAGVTVSAGAWAVSDVRERDL